MTGVLDHTPERIVAQAIIDLGLGDNPLTSTSDFPVYASQEPETPDNLITVLGTVGVKQGRIMVDGETTYRDGVQIRVRAANNTSGGAKVHEIADALDKQIKYTGVLISGTWYRIFSFSRTSGPLSIGRETPKAKRDLFTLNGTVLIRKL